MMSNLLEWDNVNPALPSISCIWASGSSKARANASTVGWMAYRIYPNGFLRRAFCQYLLSCSTVHPSYRFPQSFEAAFLKSSHPSAQRLFQRLTAAGFTDCFGRQRDRCSFKAGFLLPCFGTPTLFCPPVGMFFHIPVIYVHCDVIKQLSANLICLSVKNNDIDHHLVFQQKFADGIDCNLQSLVFWIAVNTGGNQRKATD